MSLPDAKEMSYWSAYDSLKKELQYSYEDEVDDGDVYEINMSIKKHMPGFYKILVRSMGDENGVIGAIDNILSELSI